MKQNDRKSIIMNIAAVLIFGTIGIFRRYIPLSSSFLAFSRGILGGLFILFYVILTKKNTGEKLPVKQFLWLAMTGAVMGINWILLFEAYNYTTVAVATLCYYMQPTIVMLVSPILFKEKLTKKKGLCTLLAIIGMVLVSGVLDQSAGVNLKGVVLGLGAAVFYSGVVIMNKKIYGVDAYQKTIVQLFSAGMVMIPYLFLTNGFGFEGLQFSSIVLLLIVGLVHTGIAYVLYFGSMDGLRAQSVALLSYIDPVSALLFSAFLLREPLSLLNIIGAVLIIGSAMISELGESTNN
ncbi:MAG: EamA family transporter [Solobacterium sp.]|nr:EamA family transporter [Solobacterium sp.]